MRNVSNKSCRENQNTHFTFSNFFFFDNRAVYYEMMLKKKVEPKWPQMTSEYGAYELHVVKKGYMHALHAHAHAPGHTHACARVQTHTHTHTCVIFIASPLQE